MKELKGRIEEWRRTRAKRTVMPEDLWQATGEAGKKYGKWRVAHALHVNYESLMSRVTSAGGCVERTGVQFVELCAAAPSASSNKASAELEMTDGGGRTLRLKLDGVGAGEVVGLAEKLWGCRS